MNNLVIVLENFEYGGVSTHIEILLNNKIVHFSKNSFKSGHLPKNTSILLFY